MSDNGVWAGIDAYSLPTLQAKRWTKRVAPTDIVIKEEQGIRYFEPCVKRDTITTVSGSIEVKVNRDLKYETGVSSFLHWIRPRKMLAIRVMWLTQECSGRVINHTHTTLLKAEYTWFYERYMFKGQYNWASNKLAGLEILHCLRTMKELRFD